MARVLKRILVLSDSHGYSLASILMKAEAMGAITENSIDNFVWKDIICRFGILANIITDNGPQFQKKFNRYCSSLHIKYNPTSVQTP